MFFSFSDYVLMVLAVKNLLTNILNVFHVFQKCIQSLLLLPNLVGFKRMRIISSLLLLLFCDLILQFRLQAIAIFHKQQRVQMTGSSVSLCNRASLLFGAKLFKGKASLQCDAPFKPTNQQTN